MYFVLVYKKVTIRVLSTQRIVRANLLENEEEKNKLQILMANYCGS